MLAHLRSFHLQYRGHFLVLLFSLGPYLLDALDRASVETAGCQFLSLTRLSLVLVGFPGCILQDGGACQVDGLERLHLNYSIVALGRLEDGFLVQNGRLKSSLSMVRDLIDKVCHLGSFIS